MATNTLERPIRQISPTLMAATDKLPNLTLTRIDHSRTRDAGFYVITPAVAKAILENKNGHNRQLGAAKVAQLVADISEGSFTLNGESIIFSTKGDLLDGQHRLDGCAKAGKPIESVVVFGIEPVAQDSVDQGKVRGPGDVLSIDGYKNGNEIAAAARSLIAYERTNGQSVGNRGVVTRAQIFSGIMANPGLMDTVQWALGLRNAMKGVCSPSIMAFARYVLEGVYGDEAVYYLERVCVGDNISPNDPAFTARKRLIETKIKTQATKVEVIFRGCVAHMEGRPLTRVQLEGRLPSLPKLSKAA